MVFFIIRPNPILFNGLGNEEREKKKKEERKGKIKHST